MTNSPVKLRLVLPLRLSVFCLLIGMVLVATVRADENTEQYPSIWNDLELREMVLTGIDYTITEQYAAAESLFSVLATRYPQSPVGPLFWAGTIQTEMLDLEDGRLWPEAHTLIEETIEEAEAWATADPHNPEPYFFSGTAYGYWAMHESHWGRWYIAIEKGLKAGNRFKTAVELDPTFIDAYVGLGSYQYWKSAKMTMLSWLPLVEDERRTGIRHLERVAARGTFAKTTAKNSLVWIWLDYGFPQKAYELSAELREKYPESKMFWWASGQAALESYRWQEAIAIYDTLATRITDQGPGNYYNLIECAYYTAIAAYEAGEYARCRTECQKAHAYPAPQHIRKRQKDKLAELEELFLKLNNYATEGQ